MCHHIRSMQASTGCHCQVKENPENEFILGLTGNFMVGQGNSEKALKAGKSQETKWLWQSSENILFKEYVTSREIDQAYFHSH